MKRDPVTITLSSQEFSRVIQALSLRGMALHGYAAEANANPDLAASYTKMGNDALDLAGRLVKEVRG